MPRTRQNAAAVAVSAHAEALRETLERSEQLRAQSIKTEELLRRMVARLDALEKGEA